MRPTHLGLVFSPKSIRLQHTDTISKGTIWTDLSADQVETLIFELSKHRMMMEETVPLELEPNSRLATIPEPIHGLNRDPSGRLHFVIRHPGIGWQSFFFSEEQAKALAAKITELFQESSPSET